MARSTRFLTLAALLSFFAATAALAAGEKGLVSASGGVLKSEPKPKGKKVDKLKQGSMVDVVDHSPDGLWVKVAVSGADGSQEGWVEKTYVRSLSRYGFTWERKDKAGGPQLTTKTKPEPAATSEEGWGTTAEPAATGTAAEGWDNGTPAPDATATAEEGWGNEGTPAPAASATPAEDDGWGNADLTK